MKLKDFLKLSKIREGDFAAQLGVSQSSVSRYATGRAMPKPKTILEIERLTDGAVTWRDFVNG